MASSLNDTRLFQSFKIGKITTSHRVIMSPLTRYRNDEDNVPLPIAKEYYGQRASTPGTLIISEAISPSLRTAGLHPNQPGIWSEAQIAAWRQITDAVHAKGSFMFAQLFAAGRAAIPDVAARRGLPIQGPSRIGIDDGQHITPEEMSPADMEGVIEDFAQGARNAMERAGFDGVEIHSAYGTLIDQFCHTSSNQRTDAWGGSVEGRAKFALDVAEAVIAAVGKTCVGMRFSPYSTYLGVTSKDPLPQFVYLASELRRLGLTWLHVVEPRMDGIFEVARQGTIRPVIEAWGHVAPVIVNGGYAPDNVKDAVDKEYGAFNVAVSFGRWFIANPDLPFRMKNGLKLNPYDRATFYAPKQAEGYMDYAFSQEFTSAKQVAVSSQNSAAQALRALHCPSTPLVLANVYDTITAKAVATLPTCHALATASYSIAAAAGLKDEDLDLETNMRAVTAIAAVARDQGKPLTVDLQDGYGEQLTQAVQKVIDAGAVGINLEDATRDAMYTMDGAAARIQQVVELAVQNRVPDFVVNARSDTLLHGGSIDDAVRRGKAYLKAGAYNIFVWGGPKRGGLTRSEVEQLTVAFGGRLNVMMSSKSGSLTVREVAEIGVARCSVGPALQFAVAEAVTKAATEVLGG